MFLARIIINHIFPSAIMLLEMHKIYYIQSRKFNFHELQYIFLLKPWQKGDEFDKSLITRTTTRITKTTNSMLRPLILARGQKVPSTYEDKILFRATVRSVINMVWRTRIKLWHSTLAMPNPYQSTLFYLTGVCFLSFLWSRLKDSQIPESNLSMPFKCMK